MGSALSQPWVERVAQAVAHQVDGQHGGEDREAREGHDPRVRQHQVAGVGEHGAPFGLGFLGLGAQPPTPSWGAMVADGRDLLRVAPWVSVAPGLAIGFAVLGFNLVGDALRELYDPRLRNQRA